MKKVNYMIRERGVEIFYSLIVKNKKELTKVLSQLSEMPAVQKITVTAV